VRLLRGGLVACGDEAKAHTKLSCELDEDADPAEDVERREDLEPLFRERELWIENARRGKRRNRNVEPVDDTPVLPERIGERPD
jgi:hypothetical protein